MSSGSSDAGAAVPVEPASVSSFGLRVEQGDTAVTAHVHGELDVVTAPAFEAQLAEICDGGARTLTLDLAELAFIDSSGLSALVSALKRFQSVGGGLVLRSPTRATAKVLEICGLNQVFTIEGGAAAAEGEEAPVA